MFVHVYVYEHRYVCITIYMWRLEGNLTCQSLPHTRSTQSLLFTQLLPQE